MNTTQALVTRLLAPYATAATILATATRHTWQALRCDRALDIYRTLSILLQVAGWLAFLACLYTLQAGKAARRYYEAEWAAEANTLALRIDRALAPLDGGATLPQADALPQDSPSNPAPEVVIASLDHAIALDTAAVLLNCPSADPSVEMAMGINPKQVQAIIDGSGTLTNKFRSLASLVDIAWRHARGKNKHMRNGEIRAALAPFFASDLLAQLS